MCLTRSPHTVSTQQSTEAKKDPAILRNPYLDGTNPLILARAKSSLRIDRQPPASSPLALIR